MGIPHKDKFPAMRYKEKCEAIRQLLPPKPAQGYKSQAYKWVDYLLDTCERQEELIKKLRAKCDRYKRWYGNGKG